MTGTSTTPTGGARGRAFAGGVAITVASLIGLYGADLYEAALDRGEGNRPKAYYDSARIATVCRGLIRVNGRAVRITDQFTPAECAAMNEPEAVRHLQAALDAVPALREGCPQNCRRLHQIVAAGSITYNIGPNAFRNSTMARRWRAGDWWGGCVAFDAWKKVTLRGRRVVVRGLAFRRAWEQNDFCYIDLTPPRGAWAPSMSAEGRRIHDRANAAEAARKAVAR